MKASHKKREKLVGTQVIKLEPGQFIFGRKVASHETGLSEQNIRTCIKQLKTLKNLTIKPTNKFSIITIINWDTYQPQQDESNQQSNQHVTSKQPASNQQVTTDKNYIIKELKEEKKKDIQKKKKSPKKFEPPTRDQVVQYFLEKGYLESAGKKAFDYYDSNDWKDGRGAQVKNWKQKMIGVWFKKENKINGKSEFASRKYEGTPESEMSWLHD